MNETQHLLGMCNISTETEKEIKQKTLNFIKLKQTFPSKNKNKGDDDQNSYR